MAEPIEEVKSLFSETQRTVEALRSDVEAMKGKSADYIDADRQKKMQDELAAQFTAEQEAMAKRLEAVENANNRPGGAGKSEVEVAHDKAVNSYIRKGIEADELKEMSTQDNPNGGYMVASGMEAGIRARLRRSSPVRSVASVVSLGGANSYEILIERDDAGAGWVGERESRSETATPTINKINIALHELSAMPKLTQRMLDNATFDVEGWLTNYVADKFSRSEATAFVSGDGVNKPKGFLSYGKATTADDARAVETLQYTVTGASGAFATTNGADVFINAFYELQSAYQANASWMMKNTTAAATATLKDGDGSYLIQSMFNTDGTFVRTIQGRPMFIADDMPAIGADSYSIAVGDFAAGYTIVDGQGVQVLRDPYSAKPYVLLYTTKRVGGGLTESDAIKLIKFGTS